MILARALVTLGLTAGFSVSALAQEVNDVKETGRSEYMHQAPSGRIEVTPQLALFSLVYKVKETSTTNKVDVTYSGLSEAVQLEYGISDMFSVSGGLRYSQLNTSYSPNTSGAHEPRSSGMVDPDITFNGRLPAGPMAVRFGAVLSFALEDHKVKTNDDDNMASGGTLLTPFVGVEIPLSERHLLGARVSYEVLLKDNKTKYDDPSKADKTTKGGEDFDLAAFYEFLLPKVRIGTALGLTATNRTKTTSAGVTTENKDSVTKMHLDIYSPVYITPTITIFPTFEYIKYTAYNSYAITTIDGFLLNGAARFSF